MALRKLQDWKGRLLSMAGRCVLIQAVLNALQQHYMFSTALPITASLELEKYARSFLWKGTSARLHTISWEVVTTSKSEGGLGLRRLSVLCEAVLGVVAFGFIVNPSSIFPFFASKYKWRGNPWEIEEPRRASLVWKNLCRDIWKKTQFSIVRKALLAFMLWHIWKGRNGCIFNHTYPQPYVIVSKVLAHVRECLKRLVKEKVDCN
ncbi:hypothetical protein QJS10_CPB20g00727 [Acorus calamus]|uniref:Uncharacterized protein n=1 Tax=Acorus calamus TaxID=4465 RepID=A0AAV9C7V6_ACOCL|nr:hypothetical protein QJS10_CPB20g00727 [Acorus calamus]